jgi:hypothetical protein
MRVRHYILKVFSQLLAALILGKCTLSIHPSCLKDCLLEHNSVLKGTVRPDWICMRVVSLKSPLKGHQPLYVFNFLFLILNFSNNFKVLSRSMQKRL